MTARREWAYGLVQGHFEEPDLLVLRFGGNTRLEDARRTVEIYRELGTQRPFYVIVDVSRAMLSPEAWDYLALHCRPEWFRCAVFVGAGVVQKAVTKSLGLALHALGQWDNPFRYADSEAEARALVDVERRTRAATAPRRTEPGS